jgi:hypothetical protein
MSKPSILFALLACLCFSFAEARADLITFNFDGGPLYTPTPLDQTSGGLTAHFTSQHDASGDHYSIQQANVLGFTPLGFTGNCLYPGSVFGSDLLISFDQPLTDISLIYSPEEYATDSSAQVRITAYLGSNLVGTNTDIIVNDLSTYTWPTGTLAFASAQPFDNVAVHYDKAPVTGGDTGPVFMVDNINVTTVPEPGTACLVAVALGLGSLAGMFRRRKN